MRGSKMKNQMYEILNLNACLIAWSDKTIYYIGQQNYCRSMSLVIKIVEEMNDAVKLWFENKKGINKDSNIIEEQEILMLLQELIEAQKNSDYIILADLLELRFIPFLSSMQTVIQNMDILCFSEKVYKTNIEAMKKVNNFLYKELIKVEFNSFDKKRYKIEGTTCGLVTAYVEREGQSCYLHTNGYINKESFLLVDSWYHDEIDEYVVYGMGLGYHIKELCDFDDTIKIKVIESDLNSLNIALSCNNFEENLLSEQLEIIFDPDWIMLGEELRQLESYTRKKFVVYEPAIHLIGNKEKKEAIEDFFIGYQSVKNQLQNLKRNFWRNVKKYDFSIDNLKKLWIGKNIFLIAAGPSLDKNSLELKRKPSNSIFIAVGTVCKKLLKLGIRPDFIIITDAFEGTFAQLEGLEEEDIPLLVLSTVYYKIVDTYKGKKYLICQKGFKEAEDLAKEKEWMTFQTGGSVSTTAIDIAIQFCCKRMIVVGLDLAYTDYASHATETIERITSDERGKRIIEGMDGKSVYTIKNLDIYRKWIERRIVEEKEIEFIDATEGGAKIAGMKIMPLKDVMNLLES